MTTVLGVSVRTLEHLKERFVELGLDAALTHKPNAKPSIIIFDGGFEARFTALACQPPTALCPLDSVSASRKNY